MSENPYQPPSAPLESPESIEAREIGLTRKYLVGAIVIGVLEVIDAVVLGANEGAFGAVTYLVSTLELFWAIVSIYVLIRAKDPGTRLLAIVFATYIVLGMAVGALLDMSSALPRWTIIVAGVFGCAYAIASAYVMRSGPGRRIRAA